MAIPLANLRAASGRYGLITLSKSARDAQAKHEATAFLCHSHEDVDLAKGLQVLLREEGWNVYIDWQDTSLPESPNRETALAIQEKIRGLTWFLFLATPNSVRSRWCPWEIGYADSVKKHDYMLIVATKDERGTWYGNEYLQLYRHITTADSGKLAAFPAGQNKGILVSSLS